MRIKIAGYQIEVKTVPNLAADTRQIGQYSHRFQEIRIDAGSTEQQKNETLIHEILEAVDCIYDLNLDHDNQLCKLSVILHQIITDNKELISNIK